MSSFPIVPTSNIFNSNDYKLLNEGLTIEEANKLYLSLSDGIYLQGVTPGSGQPLKALVLDSSRNITNINSLTLNRTTNGEALITTNGTVNVSLHLLSNSSHLGTTSDNNFNIQANGSNVIQCLNTGNLNVVNGLNIAGTNILDSSRNLININTLRLSNVGIGNNLPITLPSDLNIFELSTTPQIHMGRTNTNGNSFIIGYTHIGDNNVLNRLFIQPQGASVNDTLTYTVNDGRIGIGSPTPTQKLEVNGNINVSSGNGFMIGGTNIDSRYLRTNADSTSSVLLRLYSTAAVGGSQTILRLGHSVASGDWFIRHYRDSLAENNTLEMLNTNSNLLGFSIGTFNGTSNGDGCMMVMNGIQGTGAWIAANQSTTNGALHLNCGIPQSVPANWNYSPTGSASASGGTVSVSLYCYNNIWVRGSTYASSDGRLKDSIQKIDSIKALNLLNVDPVWYKWKNDENNTHQLGFIAQDLIRNNLQELTMAFNNEELEEDTELNIPAGKQLTVAYDRIPLYLLEIIKNINNRLIIIEEKLNRNNIT